MNTFIERVLSVKTPKKLICVKLKPASKMCTAIIINLDQYYDALIVFHISTVCDLLDHFQLLDHEDDLKDRKTFLK